MKLQPDDTKQNPNAATGASQSQGNQAPGKPRDTQPGGPQGTTPRKADAKDQADVDETSEESFPASDPPARNVSKV